MYFYVLDYVLSRIVHLFRILWCCMNIIESYALFLYSIRGDTDCATYFTIYIMSLLFTNTVYITIPILFYTGQYIKILLIVYAPDILHVFRGFLYMLM